MLSSEEWFPSDSDIIEDTDDEGTPVSAISSRFRRTARPPAPTATQLSSSSRSPGLMNAHDESTTTTSSSIARTSNSNEETPQYADTENGSRGRKRPKNEKDWLRNKRKTLRNEGKAYTTKRGTTAAKIFKQNFDCKCSRKCSLKFASQTELEMFFNSFWKLGDYSKQNIFLRSSVKMSKIERSRTRDGSGFVKSTVFHYYIENNNESIRVCKQFFLGILQVSWGRLYRCLIKPEVHAVIDSRGKAPSSNKIDDRDVIAHIESFPSYQSHYSRKDNINKKYLSPNLNVKKMYDLYVETCQSENKQPVKEKYYYHVFSTKFNLHFKVPSKDTCQKCDQLHLKMQSETAADNKAKLLQEKSLHLANAEKARQNLREDAQSASENTYVCTFDLQKALPFPKLTTSVAYYKRNLYVYNFGIHCFNDSTGHMYVWDETLGSRGSQELASCLRKHLLENAKKHKRVILYSDACTGQNRNIKMALTLLKLVQETATDIEVIEHKFMVSGHSFLPNDTEFGLIERMSKVESNLYVPEHWVNIIKTAKKQKPKFKVIPMDRQEFLSTNSLQNVVCNRKKTVVDSKVNWLKIRWMKFERGSPFTIKFKESLTDIVGFKEINLKKRGQSGRSVQTLANVVQEPLYPTIRPVTVAKKNDMISLLPYIPPIYHMFYKNLVVAVNTRSNQNDENEENDDEFLYTD